MCNPFFHLNKENPKYFFYALSRSPQDTCCKIGLAVILHSTVASTPVSYSPPFPTTNTLPSLSSPCRVISPGFYIFPLPPSISLCTEAISGGRKAIFLSTAQLHTAYSHARIHRFSISSSSIMDRNSSSALHTYFLI